ncbi:MAG: exodeoxyribonuclease VII small subunit [Atopobiaceae bacterium]|jgi:hypothetical protein|nr:exodeoxyribonuclease VII small subunit [Atopobiaceae bacterium]MCI2173404.1 exodeoxyribonuclease VII small subunit [Atopobiaceae bacterium]MCI2207399.1 exodeoxyribonuclease VII small subunit [Atopobiaceae bacterium]
MAKNDTSAYKSFDDVTSRLDEIVEAVRGKDTSLERSLDLFDEAISLGSCAVDLVDKVDFTPEEKARLAGGEAPSAEASSAATEAMAEESPVADDAPEAPAES